MEKLFFTIKIAVGLAAIFSVTLFYNNCASSKFESQSQLAINQTHQLPDGVGAQFSCTGAFPAHSVQCFQDNLGLLMNSERSITTNCTNQRKCEFVCDVGYNLVNGECRPAIVFSCSNVVPCTNGANCNLQIGQPTVVQQEWTMGQPNCGFTCINGYGGTLCQIPPTSSFSCQGVVPNNSNLCTGDDLNLTQNFNRVLTVACSANRNCEYTCNAGYYAEDGICKPNRTCAGPIPDNADLCASDDVNLSADTSRAVFDSCSNDRKCEYICRSGFNNINGICQQNQATFQCTGAPPANADLCANDEQGLTINTSRLLLNLNTSCSARKCEYTCRAGYSNVGNQGVCVANTSCTGNDPANAQLCPGDDVALTQNTAKTLLAQDQSCSSVNKCEFTCSSGFINVSGSCVAQSVFSCTGTTPSNSVLCANDDQNLTANTPKTLRAAGLACSAAKCEYLCDAANGYTNVNGVCVRQTPSCMTPVPCVNGVNCVTITGNPNLPDIAWQKGTRSFCSFTCTPDYDGDFCENGRTPVDVACGSAEKDLPVVTHFSLAKTPTPGFVQGANDGMEVYSTPSVRISTRRIYNYDLVPTHGNYIADNYEHRKVTDTEYNSWAQGECVTSGLPIEIRQPKNPNGVYSSLGYSDWSQAKLGLKSNRRSIQLLHPLILRKNLVTIILPPGWKPTDQPGKYPILAAGVYDLNSNLFMTNSLSVQGVAKAYLNYQTPVIGLIWNGGGAFGSRTMQSYARADFNDIIQNVKTYFGGDAQRIFIFGGSRGGLTSLSMTANPENYPYRVVGVYAAVPPADVSLIASVTGITIPALFSATEWSIGLLDTWKKSFRYPLLNEMSGFTREEAHMHILGGTRSQTEWDTQKSLTSPRLLDALYNKQQQNVNAQGRKFPQVFLEVGSHDFIVPWIDQFQFRNAVAERGIDFEARTNYLAGHFADSTTSVGIYTSDALARIMGKIGRNEFFDIFRHGRHSQYFSHPTQGLKLLPDSRRRFTAEIPRVISQNVNGHLIFTGEPGTKVRMTFTFKPPTGSTATSSPDFTLNQKGSFFLDIGNLGIGTYEITKFEIMVPPFQDPVNWSNAKIVFDSTQPAKTFSTTVKTKRDDQNILRVDVLDENLHINGDTMASEIQQAVQKLYQGIESVDSTNSLKNTSYGICEE